VSPLSTSEQNLLLNRTLIMGMSHIQSAHFRDNVKGSTRTLWTTLHTHTYTVKSPLCTYIQ